MVFEILRLNKKIQSYSSVDRVLSWGARGPRFDSQDGRNFFPLNLFLRGNEPNGEGQEEQQKLK